MVNKYELLARAINASAVVVAEAVEENYAHEKLIVPVDRNAIVEDVIAGRKFDITKLNSYLNDVGFENFMWKEAAEVRKKALMRDRLQ